MNKKFWDYTSAEREVLFKENPDLFHQLVQDQLPTDKDKQDYINMAIDSSKIRNPARRSSVMGENFQKRFGKK